MFTSEKKWMPNGKKIRKFLKSFVFCISFCLFSIPFKLHHLHVILYIHIHVHTYIYIMHTYICTCTYITYTYMYTYTYT